MSDNVNIKQGIFQGVCISLIPLSLELDSSGYGYKIRTEQINHLFCMDAFKLYAKDDSEPLGRRAFGNSERIQ